MARAWDVPLAVKLHWILRIGLVAEFFGHGLAGFYRSPSWIPYFTVFGFSEQFAQDYLYYVIGSIDMVLAALVLLRPMRAVLLYMTFWGLFTAVLRPVTGESVFELVERGANYGMPLAFLVLVGWGGGSLRAWFERIRPSEIVAEDLARRLVRVMQASIALLLIGHGGLGLVADKKEWFDFFGWFGIGTATVATNNLKEWVGLFEVALGLAVLIKPLRGLLWFVLAWKVGTELLRPLVGQPNFQFIERGGDYVLPVALIWVQTWLRSTAGSVAPLQWPVQAQSVATPVVPSAQVQSAAAKVQPMERLPDPEILAAAAALNARLASQRSRFAADR